MTLAAAAILAVGFTSCDDTKDIPIAPPAQYSEGVYILNQGDYYNNIEGSLNYYDFESQTYASGVFRAANNRSIGSTPQCAVSYGSRIYLGIYESNCIEIVDKETLKSIKQISLENSTNGKGPRSMVAAKGNVYISMFDGYVARLDTFDMAIDASVKVGPNPEVMALQGDKLFVPNSGGMNHPNYNNTASVVSLEPFRVDATIEVPLNPNKFITAGGKLFLICWGNYDDIDAAIYSVDSYSEISKITNAKWAAATYDKLYIVDAPWGKEHSYCVYNVNYGTIDKLEFPEIASPSGIYVVPDFGYIVISSYVVENGYANMLVPGYNCIYNPFGKLIKKFDGGVGETFMFI